MNIVVVRSMINDLKQPLNIHLDIYYLDMQDIFIKVPVILLLKVCFLHPDTNHCKLKNVEQDKKQQKHLLCCQMNVFCMYTFSWLHFCP
jgi:hypothetical protein